MFGHTRKLHISRPAGCTFDGIRMIYTPRVLVSPSICSAMKKPSIRTLPESHTMLSTGFMGCTAALTKLAACYSRTTRSSSRCWSDICTLVDGGLVAETSHPLRRHASIDSFPVNSKHSECYLNSCTCQRGHAIAPTKNWFRSRPLT